MSCLYNVFAAFNDVISNKFEKFTDEVEIPDRNLIVLARFNEDDVTFSISQNSVDFYFKPSKIIEQVKLTWFEDDKPKNILFKELSSLSMYQKTFHEPEYFHNQLKKVYFRYINKQILPYRFSTKMK